MQAQEIWKNAVNRVMDAAPGLGALGMCGVLMIAGNSSIGESVLTHSPEVSAAVAPGLGGVIDVVLNCNPSEAILTETGQGADHVDVSENGQIVASGNLGGNSQVLHLPLTAGEVAAGQILTFTVRNLADGKFIAEGSKTATCGSGGGTTTTSSTQVSASTTTTSVEAATTTTTAIAAATTTTGRVGSHNGGGGTGTHDFPDTHDSSKFKDRKLRGDESKDVFRITPPTPTEKIDVLPLTGSRNTAMPLAVALGLLLSGGAAVGLASRREQE